MTSPAFYAMLCKPGQETPETPLLYVVESVTKVSGSCVLAYMKKPGRGWTRWRYLLGLDEITPAPACFTPSHPFPQTREDWRRNGS